MIPKYLIVDLTWKGEEGILVGGPDLDIVRSSILLQLIL